jgi:Uma2 family endonuclease
MNALVAEPEVVMSAVLKPKLTLQEYLIWENAQPEKHEFHRGEIFAMTGGRRTHGRVVSNLNRRVSEAMDGSGCQVFAEGMKVQVADDTVLYPDVFVTCDRADLSTDQIFRAPKLVIEVLSPSTQAYDRSKKFALYRQLASLQEYILVDPDTRRIESFTRSAQGEWVLHDMSDDAAMVAASIECTVAMSDVFAGIEAAEAP